MKISYKWLQEFVEIEKTPEELADVLTSHSFEVEGVQNLGAGLDKVVVGEVVFKDKHPDADRLSVTKVKVSENEILDIVCGAPNVEAGQKVAVALVGADLPCGMKIEQRKVRGEKSCGMICAEDELGLGKSHEGIMVLDSNLKIGTPIKEALGLDDAVLEIDILPNRAHDCLCHYGVAREVAALTGKKLVKFGAESLIERTDSSSPNALLGMTKVGNKNSILEIDVLEKDLCRRYSAAVLADVQIGESPSWIKKRLESCELRPINNIVDITNYIMFSYGQPMHAFDADKIKGKIIVRRAKAGEKIVALDDKEYELSEMDLVIADEKKPIAIAGVIGGKDTAVAEGTKNIIFESANFAGTGIRKTAQRLKVFTDASYRFEREIDPEITMKCLQEAVKFAKKIAGGEVRDGFIDAYFEPRKEKTVEFDYSRIENLLGINIPKEEAIAMLNSLELRAESEEERIKITVPTWRIDIEKVNDVVEEIARIYGYGNIKSAPALVEMKQVAQDPLWHMEREMKETWKGLGFYEVSNYSFMSEKDLENFCLGKECLELKNYLTEEHKFFRNSLIPRLVKNVQENLKYRDEVMVFELGRVAVPQEGNLPVEIKHISGAWAAERIKGEELFYAGKGKVEAFLESMGFGVARYEAMQGGQSLWHNGRAADILIEGKLVGKIGEIHPQVLNKLDFDSRIFAFEIYEEELGKLARKTGAFHGINKMPTSEFDLAVIVDENVQWQEITDLIVGLKDSDIKEAHPFDVYKGGNIGQNKKSVAFRVVCQAKDKTLSDEEIKSVMDKIVEVLKGIGGEIRK